jgi:hypothetical protein
MDLGRGVRSLLLAAVPRRGMKKADVAADFTVCGHIGLLVNGPPGTAELPLI